MSSKFKLSPKTTIINSYGFNREQKLWLKQYVESIIARNAKLFMQLQDVSVSQWGMLRSFELHAAARHLLDSEEIDWGCQVMEVATQLNRLRG